MPLRGRLTPNLARAGLGPLPRARSTDNPMTREIPMDMGQLRHWSDTMTTTLSQIHPPECICNDCYSGNSQPFRTYGDSEQFRGLLHGDLGDQSGSDGWMQTALRECPQRLAEFLVDELAAGRLLSRQALQAKVTEHVFPGLFTDSKESTC